MDNLTIFESALKNTGEVKPMYINGQWVKGDQKRKIYNPGNNQVIDSVSEGGIKEVNKAVQSAKEAFYHHGWRESYARTRADLLLKVASKLEEQKDTFAKIETLNNGKIYEDALVDVEDAIHQFKYYAGLAMQPHGQTYDVPDEIQAMVIREPVGVVSIIVPWNFPLVMAVQKISAALAAGCTVIVKPAGQTPLTIQKLFEIIDEVGFPNGVVNLIFGPGSVVGDTLVKHKDVDKITFTGGTDTGKNIMKDAADTIKKIGLELGGKSPNIVFSDSDFDTAVDYAMLAIFAGQGQVCSAGSRLIVEKSIYDDFVRELVDRTKNIKIGPGWEPDTEMGPLISSQHLKQVLDYVNAGVEEGATLLCGGNQLQEGIYAEGNYMEPTIFTDTTPDMRIVQEEIFGPVLAIQVFETEEEALALANGTDFGLAAAVFTNDSAKAQRVIRAVHAGITWVNCYHPTFNEAPWSGYKQSGIGGDLGTYGFEEYLNKKQVNISLDVKPSGAYHYKGKS